MPWNDSSVSLIEIVTANGFVYIETYTQTHTP
uniref:Uncharacterized protein n=1 Tax=Rhizophora mucronata TaxID=61149 RepID=A0A2P2PQD7_RHIMU